MDENQGIEALACLAHGGRLALFRLLVRRWPDWVPAGDLANALGVKASTLSVHLSMLSRAGLIRSRRDGRSIRYAASPDRAGALVAFLVRDCCYGRPDICLRALGSTLDPLGARAQGATAAPINVLFLCSGNSARSIFAEAVLREDGGDRFRAFSAGTSPATGVNPVAAAILARNGYSTESLRSKHVSEFEMQKAPAFDIVITVCDRAANEHCAAWSGAPMTPPWGMADPVRAVEGASDPYPVFQATLDHVRHRVQRLTALPVADLDRVALQHALDQIAMDRETV